MGGDDDAPHTAGQAAYAQGATEYQQHVHATPAFPDPLSESYEQGREEAIRAITGQGDGHPTHQFAGPDQPGGSPGRGDGVVYGHLPGSGSRRSSPAVADVLFGRLDR
ncbi:hypothetical protein [Streptomyces chartreusis]|uniref:hypothetical protein n=1 Tax=Streptomyces chartreusis TaxID=1969 RepID=UPI00380AC488